MGLFYFLSIPKATDANINAIAIDNTDVATNDSKRLSLSLTKSYIIAITEKDTPADNHTSAGF